MLIEVPVLPRIEAELNGAGKPVLVKNLPVQIQAINPDHVIRALPTKINGVTAIHIGPYVQTLHIAWDLQVLIANLGPRK